MTRALSTGLLIVLTACSPSTPADDAGSGTTDTGGSATDGGAFAADCVIYCEGFYSCGNTTSPSCRFTMPEPAFRSDCEAACVSAAQTMTPAQVTEATTCLHCLDGYVDQSTCTGSGLGDAGGNNTLYDAILTCGTGCMTDGVMTINNLMLTNFLNLPAPDAGRYTCSDAGP